MKAVKRPPTSRRSAASGPPEPEFSGTSVSNKSSVSPTTVELRGVSIHFPFKPYACQETYMEKVLDALHRSENALLESPTGTGKTLCLLCSTLAWQRQQARLLPQNSQVASTRTEMLSATVGADKKPNGRVPTIIYASRTHSQLSQVVRELRNTRYRPRHAILGSREQMCVNPKVKTTQSSASDVNHECNRLCKDRKCRFRNSLEGFVAPSNESFQHSQVQSVMDMEDLVTMGRTKKVCPFYYTRSLVSDAELILMPYNYLFDKDARESTLAEVPWDDAVLIFDESHNLESFASDSASFDLSSADIGGCMHEIQRAINYVQPMQEQLMHINLDNLVRLKALFMNLEEYIVQRLATNPNVFHGEKMMEIFRDGMSISHANHAIFLGELKKVDEATMEISAGIKGNPKLDAFATCIKRVFGESTEARCFAKARAYRVYVSPKEKGGGRTISYWCFAPSLAMQEIADLNVRSIIVTSGTLSPLLSYSMELGIPFPHILENPHIIEDDQICVKVIGRGVSGQLLNSSYNRREDASYILELGNTLVSLAKIVPGGMLVFFPSYGVMENCVERWGGPSRKFRPNDSARNSFFQAQRRKNSPSAQFAFSHAPDYYESTGEPATPWKRLLARKAVILEPKTTADLPDAIAEFHKLLGAPKSTGCVLMGVCRGKISEGIDFSHDMCRAVVITGLPFAPYMDPKVKLKREYLDNLRTSQSIKASGDGGFGGEFTGPVAPLPITLSGAEWYSQQAHRAVNQAIGRVIRNKTDYGAVLLLDSRFGEARNQDGLSKWVRPHIRSDEGFGAAIGGLARFYKEAQRKSDERKKKDQASLPRKSDLMLQYESDCWLDTKRSPSDLDGATTKIAVVQNPASQAKDAESDGATYSYVPPNQVIARMDLGEAESAKRKDMTEITASDDHDPERGRQQRPTKTLDALYGRVGPAMRATKSAGATSESSESAWSNFHPHWKSLGVLAINVEARKTLRETIGRNLPNTGSQRSSKSGGTSPAVLFFEKARACASADEMSTIKKYIVEMKKHGEKNDPRSYLRAAQIVLDVLIRHDNFDNGKSDMLDLFFHLLPRAHQDHVHEQSLRLRFRQSQFYKSCELIMTEDDFKRLNGLVSTFLVANHIGTKRKLDVYLRECDPILDLLRKYNRVAGRADKMVLTDFFPRLVPARLRPSTQAMIRAKESSSDMSRLKHVEREKMGENGIETIRFIKPHISANACAERGQAQTIQTTSPEMLASQKSMEAALMRADDLNRARRERIQQIETEKSKAALKKNPYASTSKRTSLTKHSEPFDHKKATKRIRVSTKIQERQQNDLSDPVADCLREAESHSYVNQALGDKGEKRTIQYNTPAEMRCGVCTETSKKHYSMAPCGHTACSDCWIAWLRKASTCCICRLDTTRDSLMRLVFEKAPGAGAPSFSQLCQPSNENDSSEGELEIIIKGKSL